MSMKCEEENLDEIDNLKLVDILRHHDKTLSAELAHHQSQHLGSQQLHPKLGSHQQLNPKLGQSDITITQSNVVSKGGNVSPNSSSSKQATLAAATNLLLMRNGTTTLLPTTNFTNDCPNTQYQDVIKKENILEHSDQRPNSNSSFENNCFKNRRNNGNGGNHSPYLHDENNPNKRVRLSENNGPHPSSLFLNGLSYKLPPDVELSKTSSVTGMTEHSFHDDKRDIDKHYQHHSSLASLLPNQPNSAITLSRVPHQSIIKSTPHPSSQHQTNNLNPTNLVIKHEVESPIPNGGNESSMGNEEKPMDLRDFSKCRWKEEAVEGSNPRRNPITPPNHAAAAPINEILNIYQKQQQRKQPLPSPPSATNGGYNFKNQGGRSKGGVGGVGSGVSSGIGSAVDVTLSASDLYGESISGFSVGGEFRMCLPQILNTILDQYPLQAIHQACDELQIYCSTCTSRQLEVLKRGKILPVTAYQCGLITKSDGQRLCSSLIDRSAPKSGFSKCVRTSPFALRVEHECFGSCVGLLLPEACLDLHTSRCIECSECQSLLSVKQFVMHSHNARVVEGTRICHWGFDVENWGSYLHLWHGYFDQICKVQDLDQLDQMEVQLLEFKKRCGYFLNHSLPPKMDYSHLLTPNDNCHPHTMLNNGPSVLTTINGGSGSSSNSAPVSTKMSGALKRKNVVNHLHYPPPPPPQPLQNGMSPMTHAPSSQSPQTQHRGKVIHYRGSSHTNNHDNMSLKVHSNEPMLDMLRSQLPSPRLLPPLSNSNTSTNSVGSLNTTVSRNLATLTPDPHHGASGKGRRANGLMATLHPITNKATGGNNNNGHKDNNVQQKINVSSNVSLMSQPGDTQSHLTSKSLSSLCFTPSVGYKHQLEGTTPPEAIDISITRSPIVSSSSPQKDVRHESNNRLRIITTSPPSLPTDTNSRNGEKKSRPAGLSSSSGGQSETLSIANDILAIRSALSSGSSPQAKELTLKILEKFTTRLASSELDRDSLLSEINVLKVRNEQIQTELNETREELKKLKDSNFLSSSSRLLIQKCDNSSSSRLNPGGEDRPPTSHRRRVYSSSAIRSPYQYTSIKEGDQKVDDSTACMKPRRISAVQGAIEKPTATEALIDRLIDSSINNDQQPRDNKNVILDYSMFVKDVAKSQHNVLENSSIDKNIGRPKMEIADEYVSNPQHVDSSNDVIKKESADVIDKVYDGAEISVGQNSPTSSGHLADTDVAKYQKQELELVSPTNDSHILCNKTKTGAKSSFEDNDDMPILSEGVAKSLPPIVLPDSKEATELDPDNSSDSLEDYTNDKECIHHPVEVTTAAIVIEEVTNTNKFEICNKASNLTTIPITERSIEKDVVAADSNLVMEQSVLTKESHPSTLLTTENVGDDFNLLSSDDNNLTIADEFEEDEENL